MRERGWCDEVWNPKGTRITFSEDELSGGGGWEEIQVPWFYTLGGEGGRGKGKNIK